MCIMVYIAATAPLELVAWDDASPAFYVSELHESEASVRLQFDTPHIRHAGSHEGCGCGFQYGKYPQFEDEERPLKRASLDAFANYLAEQLRHVPSIQLYACWDGDQSATPEHKRVLTPSSLRSKDFYFLEREHSTIKPDAA